MESMLYPKYEKKQCEWTDGNGRTADENMNSADKANEIKRTVANKLKAGDKRISGGNH